MSLAETLAVIASQAQGQAIEAAAGDRILALRFEDGSRALIQARWARFEPAAERCGAAANGARR